MQTTRNLPFFKKPEKSFFHIRVCDLAQSASCPKRAKIQYKGIAQKYVSGAMAKGTEMHREYSVPYKSFDRRVLVYRLMNQYGRVHKRVLETDDKIIELAGVPDDYRVLNHWSSGKLGNHSINLSTDQISSDRKHGMRLVKKTVALIEVKTTRKKRLWSNEVASAAFQLQLYVWLLRPHLERFGYEIHNRHYLEMYSQYDGRLLRRLVVQGLATSTIEGMISDAIDSFRGLKPMSIPPRHVCKRCPKNIREVCDWRR